MICKVHMVYCPKPRSDVFCFKLNFKISKSGYLHHLIKLLFFYLVLRTFVPIFLRILTAHAIHVATPCYVMHERAQRKKIYSHEGMVAVCVDFA